MAADTRLWNTLKHILQPQLETCHRWYLAVGIDKLHGKRRVLLVRVGDEQSLDDVTFSKICQKAMAAIDTQVIQTAHFTLAQLNIKGKNYSWAVRQATIVLEQARYQFNELKSTKEPASVLKTIIFTANSSQAADKAGLSLAQGVAISDGMQLTRDLGNRPANVCTPTYLAKTAQALAKKHAKLSVDVLDEAEMKKLKMNTLLSVSAGSNQGAKLITLHYKGAAAKQAPVVLVGKGVTFDSGGLSLKPATGMVDMKFDMLGAASVFGVIKACHDLKLPLNVLVGGEGFISSAVAGESASYWGGTGVRLDFNF